MCNCRESAANKVMGNAAAAERDAARREMQALMKVHQAEVNSLKEAFGAEKRELQLHAAAAEAEAARLDAELAAERERAERAKQVGEQLSPFFSFCPYPCWASQEQRETGDLGIRKYPCLSVL